MLRNRFCPPHFKNQDRRIKNMASLDGDGDVKMADLRIVNSCCLPSVCSVMQNCYCEYPACIGGAVNCEVCCCEVDAKFCRCIDSNKNEDERYCMWQQGGCYFKRCTSCCQAQNQCFCIDFRCSAPPTDQVPASCTLLPFCMVSPEWGCCNKISDVKNFTPPEIVGDQLPNQNAA